MRIEQLYESNASLRVLKVNICQEFDNRIGVTSTVTKLLKDFETFHSWILSWDLIPSEMRFYNNFKMLLARKSRNKNLKSF